MNNTKRISLLSENFRLFMYYLSIFSRSVVPHPRAKTDIVFVTVTGTGSFVLSV